ncbi:MAG: hypothetical protein VX876_01770 [Planctomycetota bacterium]|nr:hypothetical protein [Planctomycetota bacterium]
MVISFLTQLILFGLGPEAMPGWERVLYLFPLVICTSLVYGATRHEDWRVITAETIKIGTWLIVLTAGVFFVALILSFFN